MEKKTLEIDFLSKRKFAAILSVIIFISCVASIFVHNGLHYGIDFTGGINVQVQFSKDVPLDQTREALSAFGLEQFTLQAFGEAEAHEVLLILPIQNKLGTGESLSQGLVEILSPLDASMEIRRIESIGPKVGEELKTSAIYAIVIALGLILLYVSVRFHWRFAMGAIAALVHDTMIIVGLFSVLDKEITLTIVAALLTVIGYSLNDTIVVFDRIRENMGRFRKRTLENIMNLSINETLSRTLLTSITTLLVVGSLLFLGGEIIHDFAFALFAGILVGTYSSIYVASPVTLLISEKLAEQEKQAQRSAA